MAGSLTVRGVRFQVLGPVDRRLSAPVSPRGRICCPLCHAGGRRDVGPFYVNRYLKDHLRKEHYQCRCGWVGISPGAHVTRSLKHGPGVPRKPPRPKSVRLSDLASMKTGERVLGRLEERAKTMRS